MVTGAGPTGAACVAQRRLRSAGRLAAARRGRIPLGAETMDFPLLDVSLTSTARWAGAGGCGAHPTIAVPARISRCGAADCADARTARADTVRRICSGCCYFGRYYSGRYYSVPPSVSRPVLLGCALR
jgi:hypothetical protein